MTNRLPFLLLFIMMTMAAFQSSGQSIHNGDGSALQTKYCFEDKDYHIIGTPAGGTFNGCGISRQSNGNWVFNPSAAANGSTVFPVQCLINYTVNGATVSMPFLVWKPVILTPPMSDSFTCNGDFMLHAKTLYAGAYNYSWQPAAALYNPDTTYTAGHIDASETFILTATDISSGCIGRDTVTIIKDEAPILEVSNDTTILSRTSIQLSASGANTYEWSPAISLNNADIADPVASPHGNTVYTVTGRSLYGCYSSKNITVHINNNIFIPNAFSPNGDGINDVFKLVNFGYDEIMEFRIFDRWGKEVFSTFNGTLGWDGTSNGKIADAGTYYYCIKIAYNKGPIQLMKGDLTLVR